MPRKQGQFYHKALCLGHLLKGVSVFALVLVFRFIWTSRLMHKNGLAWGCGVGDYTNICICGWKRLTDKRYHSRRRTSFVTATAWQQKGGSWGQREEIMWLLGCCDNCVAPPWRRRAVQVGQQLRLLGDTARSVGQGFCTSPLDGCQGRHSSTLLEVSAILSKESCRDFGYVSTWEQKG